MATPALWENLGGYMFSANLSDRLRFALQTQVFFRQFADVRDAAVMAKNSGDLFTWNIYGDLSGDPAAPWISEADDMPQDGFTVAQASLRVGAIGRAVPFSEKLDVLSKHSVEHIIDTVLTNWGKKAFDYVSYAQFNATKLVVTPTGGNSASAITLATNGTPPAANNVELRKTHLALIEDLMAERNIPMRGNSYMAVSHPSTLRKLKDDLEGVYQYTQPGFQQILNGEIGRYGAIRFSQQTNIPKETWSNAKSNWAFFFGEDTVAEGVVIPEEMRGKIPTNYGLQKGIGMYYLGGFGIVHSDAANARIIKWGSSS